MTAPGRPGLRLYLPAIVMPRAPASVSASAQCEWPVVTVPVLEATMEEHFILNSQFSLPYERNQFQESAGPSGSVAGTSKRVEHGALVLEPPRTCTMNLQECVHTLDPSHRL